MATSIPIYLDNKGPLNHSYWINFTASLDMDTWPGEELEKTYNALIVRENGVPCILFENDHDATLFILRWS